MCSFLTLMPAVPKPCTAMQSASEVQWHYISMVLSIFKEKRDHCNFSRRIIIIFHSGVQAEIPRMFSEAGANDQQGSLKNS